MTPTYRDNAVESADELFQHFWKALPWEKRGETPRFEVFYNESGRPYTYGVEPFSRTYVPLTVWDEKVAQIKAQAEQEFGVKFEACFINGYSDQHHSLQWHADDSPTIDHERPILVYSFGAVRNIMVAEADSGHKKGIRPETIKEYTLGNGSLFVMPPGMQQTHKHRIPKHDRDCGPRVSLTFRGLL